MFVYTRFPTSRPDFDSNALWDDPSLELFSPAGQGLINSFVRQEISREELNRIIQATSRRPNYDNFIDGFVSRTLESARADTSS